MRYIEKNKPCADFLTFVKQHELDKYVEWYMKGNGQYHPWDRLGKAHHGSDIKRTLSQHLYEEQKGLCIYCEQTLNPRHELLSNFAHIEHLKPKDPHGGYPQHTFNYLNLTVSCNGFDTKKGHGGAKFCGHKKANLYDENLFLDPTRVHDIERYFEYTVSGKIQPARDLKHFERRKAEYMIWLLDLQNPELVDMRAESFSSFIQFSEEEQQLLLDEDNDLLPGFHSMLKQLTIV